MGVGVGNGTGTAVGTDNGVASGVGAGIAAVGIAAGDGVATTTGRAAVGELIVGFTGGAGVAYGNAICAGVGAGVGVGSGVGVDSGSKIVKTNKLKLSTLAVAVDATKSTSVANCVQAPTVWCWMIILSGFLAARAASAALSATVIVIGLSSGVSVVSSKALPVAVNFAGRAGISAGDRAI